MPRKIGKVKHYDVKEVAKGIGLSEHSTRLYLQQGRIKGQKVGNAWRVTENNVQAFLDGNPKPPRVVRKKKSTKG